MHSKQECIPVGSVPPAAVAVCLGGVCLSACWDTHPPPGCRPGEPPDQTPQPPLWVWPGDLEGMLGYHLPLPRGQNDRHM